MAAADDVATFPGAGFTFLARWVGRCPAKRGGCGQPVVKQYAPDAAPIGWYIVHERLVTCSCGRDVTAKMVTGSHSDKVKCAARCLTATGPNCECPCSGANHGAGH